MTRHLARLLLILALPTVLAGCDLLGIEPASALAARKEGEGKAIGGACRHAGRAIEDCYAMNRRADKAAVFQGWREMNDYMRENNIEVVKPELGPEPAAKSEDAEEEPKADKAPAKGAAAGKKAAAKH